MSEDLGLVVMVVGDKLLLGFTLRLASLSYQDAHPSDLHSCVTNKLRLGTSRAIFITGKDSRVRLVVRILHLVLQSNNNPYGPQLPRA